MSADSLGKRYLFKLVSSLIGFAISILMQSMVSRGLGPKAFGDYSFLTSLLIQLVLFFDLGNTSGFFVKLSQRPKEFGLIAFYTYFTGSGTILLLISLTCLLQFPSVYQMFFPGQERIYIMLAMLWAILARYLQVLNNISDAYGYTVRSEKAMIIQKVVAALIIATLYLSHNLGLLNYFLSQYFITLLLIGLFIFIIRDRGFLHGRNWIIKFNSVKQYLREFYSYSYPLFFGFIAGFLSVTLDRWLLQYFSGSVQQGFYGLSFQLAALSTVFAGSMTMLIMREFSIAFAIRDFTKMAYFFRRFIPLLYSLTAYISCFTAVQAGKVIYMMGGEQYKEAFLPVAIMCFYPIHQTYGQLSGSVLLASGQTGLYARLTIISTIVGIPALYILLSPLDSFGFALGATGLALKMVCIQVIFVNIQLYYNAKLLGINFWRYLLHQFGSVVVLLVISLAVYLFVEHFHFFEGNIVLSFLLSGFLYSIVVLIVGLTKPLIFGVHPDDFLYIKSFLKLSRH